MRIATYGYTCTLLHVAKIIQQAWLHRKRVTVKIKQKNLVGLATPLLVTCEPSCARFVQNKGCGHRAFPSRIMISIQKQANLSTKL